MNEIEVDYFPVWKKYRTLFRKAKLTKLDLGELFIAMMDYQFEGIKPPEFEGALLGIWVVVQADLDYARKRYETSVLNGRKGGRKPNVQPAKTHQNPEQGNTITESISESITESISITNTDTNTGSSALPDVSFSKKTYGEFGWVRLTDQEYSQLEREMGLHELQSCITYIDESAQSTGNRNQWLDWYTVLRRCYQKKWHEDSRRYRKDEIPKGASGHLGKAELEAIAQVLAT